ncbi:MAG: tetratricopeptide repeat protein, partial [Bryobacteraceae bacterium]
ASGLSYSVMSRNGSFFLRRSSPPLERRIDYTVGSGDHSKTFLTQGAKGKLLELPLSWYSESGGSWNMSPGYDRPDHSDFRREVPDSCLFCHNGYPSKTNGGLAQGIDCQRCHGPGESHVSRKGPIVNPAKLSAERRLEVCLQCHLESASRTLPDAIRRFDRTAFSYRPGEPLSDFILYFQFTNSPAEDRITVNGSAYGMMKSQCYLRSSGRLSCTTCHDPHLQPSASQGAERYTQACRNCHPSTHETTRRDCAGCHMQKRRTEDAVHVIMTDHHIRRTPLTGDLLAPLRERHDRITGRVELLYPPNLPASPKNALYLAMAQGDMGALRAAITKTEPSHIDPYIALPLGLQREGHTPEAVSAYREVIQRFPDDPRAYIAAAQLLPVDQAIALLEPATVRLPVHSGLLNSLAVLYSSKQRFDDALPLLTRAVQAEPEDPLSWLNLGVCLEAKGDRNGAMAAYRQTLTLDPGSVRAAAFLHRLSGQGR